MNLKIQSFKIHKYTSLDAILSDLKFKNYCYKFLQQNVYVNASYLYSKEILRFFLTRKNVH